MARGPNKVIPGAGGDRYSGKQINKQQREAPRPKTSAPNKAVHPVQRTRVFPFQREN